MNKYLFFHVALLSPSPSSLPPLSLLLSPSSSLLSLSSLPPLSLLSSAQPPPKKNLTRSLEPQRRELGDGEKEKGRERGGVDGERSADDRKSHLSTGTRQIAAPRHSAVKPGPVWGEGRFWQFSFNKNNALLGLVGGAVKHPIRRILLLVVVAPRQGNGARIKSRTPHVAAEGCASTRVSATGFSRGKRLLTRKDTWQTQGEHARTAACKARTRPATSSLPRLVGRRQSVSNSRVHEPRQVLHV